MPVLEDSPMRTGPAGSGSGWQLFDPGGGRRLDELVCALWDEAGDGRPISCLVCEAQVEPNRGGHLECPSCGTVLE
jgi:hypothetical protein